MKKGLSGPHLWLVLWRAAHAVETRSHTHIASLGLAASDFAALEALLHKGPLPVNEIGRKVLLTSGSITTAVDRLEKKGMVKRESHPEDRRVRVVRLTGKGKKFITAAFAAHARELENVAAPLSPTERKTLLRLLKKLGKHAASPPSTEIGHEQNKKSGKGRI